MSEQRANRPAVRVARSGRRLLLGLGLAFVVAPAALAAAFLWGVAIPGDFLRGPLERALTAAFGVPARIEGPLLVRTGLSATATADALVLADPSGPPGATLARGIRPVVRIDLVSLARGAVALEEVTGERLELTLVRRADERGNWAPVLVTAPGSRPPTVTFAGIAQLRLERVTGTFHGEGAAPVRFEVSGFEGALPLRDPTSARGTATIAMHTVEFDLRSASLADLGTAAAVIPLRGTLDWSGARVSVDGNVASDGSRLDASVRATAGDMGALFAALGVAAREPGKLDARARIGVTESAVVASDFALSVGDSAVSGSGRVTWGKARSRLAIDVSGERVDLAPFLAASPATKDSTSAEALVELLERVATGIDGEAKLAIGEVAGLPVTLRELKLDGRSNDGVVAVRGEGAIASTRAKATLDYDARKPRRVLAARIDGGAISTSQLPGAGRPQPLTGSSGAIRGQLRGQGADPRAIVASAEASLDARDLRWTLAARDGKPVSGRFDVVRIAVQGTRASSAEVTGRLGDVACALKGSGGALAPLLEGRPWPAQLTGSCGGGRLTAKGRIAFAERHLAADLAFDAAAERIGPVAQALGVAPDAPYRFAARGTLALDEKLARVRLDAIQLGRSAGSGELALALGAGGVPRVRLALTTLNVEEINSLVAAGPKPPDPLEREVLRKNLRLPEAQFEVSADRVDIAEAPVRHLHLSGVMHGGRLPPARFRFESGGMQVSGELAVDFTGAAPRVQLDGTAQSADLGALAGRSGGAGVGLRADALSFRVRAEGEQLGDLLASAILDAAIERGRLDLAQPPAPGLPGPAEFSATLKAAPGQPAMLVARGTMGGEPFDLSLGTPSLVGLARAGEPMPVTLHLTLGDVRLQAAGKVARDGTGEGRLQLSGTQLDRLGKLAGLGLPEIGPYAAAGTVVVSSDAIRVSDVDLSFGRSRVLGNADLQVRRAGRPSHSAALRATALHLEDLGASRWLGGPAQPKAGEAPTAQREEAEIARALERLRASDVDASLEIDALHGAAERFASGRLRATLAAGVLRVELQDVKTAGGTVDADLRVDASGAQPKFAARARVDGLDFGPLVRTLDPATKLGGRLDLVADLAAQGPPGRLLPALAGKIDVAVFPHDLRSEALAFWGTGLLSTMLRSLDPDTRSEVECAAASLDIGSGVASTTALFVDTTRVRIIGQIDADLVTRALSGRLRPLSEQPELFTVAPTMAVGGTIESPRLSIAPENVVLAPLRFATPLAGLAVDFLTSRGKLREGVAGCRQAFERARELHPALGGAK